MGHVLCDREEGEDGRKCKETYRDPVLMPDCGGILRAVEKETPPLIMIRIASLERMAEPVTSDEPVELVVEVYDPIVPDNAGIFRWSLDSGGSVVRACKEQPEWKVKIDELGEFLFGVKTAQEWRSEPVFRKLQAIRPFRSVSIQEIV